MKFTGPVRFIFSGNKEACSRYTGRARLYLQQAIDRMGSMNAAWKRQEPDGTTIRIASWGTGHTIEITCPGVTEYDPCTSGFYIEPISDEAPLGFGSDKQTPLTAEDIEDGLFPGYTLEDGDIKRDNVEFNGAGQKWTLDWTAKEFKGYLVWPATFLKNGTDGNSVNWEPFHRYYCKPDNGRLYYCNADHSGGPGGLALGYGVRTLGKSQYLYCVASTDGVNLKVHRRVWTTEPYEDDDELSSTNPLGWELLDTVTVLDDQGYGTYQWTSGAYFNPDADKFVIAMRGSDVDIPRGYIEVEIDRFGTTKADRTGLLDYDEDNGFFSESTDTSSPFPNKSPSDGDYYDVGADLTWTNCTWSGDPLSTLPSSGDAVWAHFSTPTWTYMTTAHTTTTELFEYNDVVLGADYDQETGEIKLITQTIIESAFYKSGVQYDASGGYSNTESLVGCSSGCGGGAWAVTRKENSEWTAYSWNQKSWNIRHIYDNSPDYSYNLETYGNKTGNKFSRGDRQKHGTTVTHYYRTWSCPTFNNYGSLLNTHENIYSPGTVDFRVAHLLYLDMRYGTFIRVEGSYTTTDGGVTYDSEWQYNINDEVVETYDISPYSIHSSDTVSGFSDTIFPSSNDRKWDYSLVPEFDDNLTFFTNGNVFTDKDGDVIAEIPEFTVSNGAWNGSVIPDQTKFRLYYTPFGFDALEELGFSGTNLQTAKLRLA